MEGTRNGLTSEIAMYYYMMGKDAFDGDIRRDMSDIFMERSEINHYTDDDIQQVWEVYVELTAQNRDLWRINPKNIARKDGNPRLLKEWSEGLYLYNRTMLVNEWYLMNVEQEKLGDLVNKYRKLYHTYRKATGRNLYLCRTSSDAVQGLSPVEVATLGDYPNTKDADKAKRRYRGMVNYELDEVLEHYLTLNKPGRKNLRIKPPEFEDIKFGKWVNQALLMYIDSTVMADWGN